LPFKIVHHLSDGLLFLFIIIYFILFFILFVSRLWADEPCIKWICTYVCVEKAFGCLLQDTVKCTSFSPVSAGSRL